MDQKYMRGYQRNNFRGRDLYKPTQRSLVYEQSTILKSGFFFLPSRLSKFIQKGTGGLAYIVLKYKIIIFLGNYLNRVQYFFGNVMNVFGKIFLLFSVYIQRYST